MTLLRHLATMVACAQDRAIGKLPSASIEGRLAALHAAQNARSRARRLRGLAAISISCIAAGATLFLWMRPAPLQFELGVARTPGVVGARVEAPPSDPLPMHFSDGTEIVLDGSAGARVLSLEPHGAHVVVEHGSARVAAVPRAQSAWLVAVGPFDVHVKGTRFDAAWDAKRESFSLKMYEGTVIVTGRCLTAPRTSTAGDVLDLTCSARSSSPSVLVAAEKPERATTEALLPSDKASAACQTSNVGRLPAKTSNTLERATTVEACAWRAPLARGDSAGALAVLEASNGRDDACPAAGAEDLMRLGEAARSLGRRPRAVQIYQAVRRRFPDTDVAALAAFHLGQVAFDQGGSLDEARSDFAAYLAERPNGPLAQEALGRLLEIDQRTDARSARSLAERYLERFPRGPRATLARSIVSP